MAQKCLYDQYSPVVVTPVKEINTIGNIHIYGKMENQQRGGSLKIRGAYNKLYKVLDRARFMNQ
jgi:threonine dehydratase